MAGSRHGSGSGSSSRGDGAAVLRPAIVLPTPNVVDPIYVGDKTRNSSGDTCGYYKPQGGSQCRQPRSCYDCLNAHLAGVEGGCVLSPTGACQPIGAYLASRDYRANHSSTPVSAAYNNYFPSINTTYCEPTDAACDRCRKIALTDVISSSASMITLGQWNGSHEIAQRFCIGAKDCVCLAACTPEKWKNNVQEDCSPANSNGTANAETTPETYRSMLPIFMALQFLLILMVIHRQRLYANRFRRATRPEGPYNNPRAISSPSQRLQLTGWRAMQQDLVNREKARRGLVSLMSPRDNNTFLQQTQQSQPPSQPEGEVQPEAQQPEAQQPQPRPSQAHNYVLYEPEDEDIPEMPPGSPMTPMAAPRRRASTDASVAMLEDGRTSESATNTQQRAPAVSNIEEGREAKSH